MSGTLAPIMKFSRFVAPLLAAIASAAFAQEPPPPTPPPTPPVLPAPVQPATLPQPPKIITKEQTVYIPFEKLEEVFAGQEQGVFLPYREFLEMWNKLNLPEKLKNTEPPVEGVLASASYTGRVEGEVAEIKAKLAFEALKDGWSRLKLGAGGLSIADAKSTALLNFADGA